jgi:endoglucanase
MNDLIKKLAEAPAVSGNEQAVSEIIKKELKGRVDEIKTDAFGNIFTRKGRGKPVIMVASHMDEIGLMVRHIDDNGYIKFARVGGVNEQMLHSQRVTVSTKKGPIPGVIGSKPVHMLTEEERKKPVKADDMYIDIGYPSRKEVEKAGAAVGDWVSLVGPVTDLGKMISGKAFDNRIGCYALVEIMKSAKPKGTLYGIFTVQEEVGLRGARISAYSVSPDLGIALDTTLPGDSPNIKPEESAVKLGKGPVVTLADGGKETLGGGTIASPLVRDWLIGAAKRAKIPHQVEVVAGGTTDATAIQLTKEGIPATALGIPTRNLHTPVQVADPKDIENSIKLVLEAVKNPPRI